MKVYFDNAATTSLDPAVFEKMRQSFLDNYGNPNSVHFIGRKAQNSLDTAREEIANLIGASFNEIYFTSGGTEADNFAIKGVALAQNKRKILVSSIEHSATLAACEDLRSLGYVIEYLRPNENGIITKEELSSKIDQNVALVSVMYVNNETGVINPIKDLASIAKQHGVLFHTDAVQAANTQNINVKDLGVDLLSLSAHKIHGPKGVGLLYVKEGVPIRSIISGGFQERGKRGGTIDLPLIVGFAEALKIAFNTREQNIKKLSAIKERFESGLNELEIAKVNFTQNVSPCISNVRFEGINAQALMTVLDINGIAVSIGSACTAGSVLPSHVLKAIGLSESDVASSMRFSFGKLNTFEEVDYVLDVLKSKLDGLKGKRLFVSRQEDKFLG